MLGGGTQFSVHFVGDLFVAEILLVVAFTAMLFVRGRRAIRPELKFVYALMALWLLGQTISDVYNHIPLVDRIRGTALIVFFAIDIVGISILIGNNQRRKILYMVGLTVGALAQVKLQPSPAAEDYPWKFGYAFGTMLAVYADRLLFLAGESALCIYVVFGRMWSECAFELSFADPSAPAHSRPGIPDRSGTAWISSDSSAVPTRATSYSCGAGSCSCSLGGRIS